MQNTIKNAATSIINRNTHYHNELNFCYPDYIFINKDEISDLICPINFGILNDPVTDICGHSFCKHCIGEWLKTDSKCPYSRKLLNQNELYPNLTIKNLLAKQLIHCVNSDCNWQGSLESLYPHLEKECDYTKVKCKYSRCTAEMDRKDASNHEKKCEMKVIVCEYCHHSLDLNQYYKHKEICFANTVKCDQCFEQIAKCFYLDHIKKECPESVIHCCLSEYGCGIQTKKKEIDTHIQQNLNSHISLIEGKFKKDITTLTEDNKKMKGEYSAKFQELWEFVKQMKTSYENENHTLKKENSYLRSRLEKFKLENDDLRDSFIALKDEKYQEIKNLKMIIEDIFASSANPHTNPNIYQSHKQFNHLNNEQRPNTQRQFRLENEASSSVDKNRNQNNRTQDNIHVNNTTPPKDLGRLLKPSIPKEPILEQNNNKFKTIKEIFGSKVKDISNNLLDFEKCKPKKILPLLCHKDYIEDICCLGTMNKNLVFATCSNDKMIKIWSLLPNNTCTLMKCIEEHTSAVNRLLYIQFKKLLISASSNGIVMIWRIENWSLVKSLQAHGESILGLTAIEGTNYFATSSVDKTINIWDLDSFHLKLNYELKEVITEIFYVNVQGLDLNQRIEEKQNEKTVKDFFERKESYLLAGDAKGNLYVNELENKAPFIKMKQKSVIKAHDDAIFRILFISCNKTIVTTSFEDDKIKIWNAFNMEIVQVFNIYDKGIISVTYDPVNEVLISSGQRENHRLIKIIKIEKYAVIRAFKEEYSSKNVLWISDRSILFSSGGTIGWQGKMNIIFF